MQRTISAMVGKGSVNHNSRKFRAENVDGTRTHLNIDYCNENIKTVYHELFDEALERYNAKQIRSDRKIKDYYEKIRSSKQEKPFHEIILQVGGKGNMNADTENGELAKQILDEYYQGFQERNPQLRVFSAHLHMDEATPHLHIDFVPFTTGSKRGLDTRVSLKQALATQGFKGGSRGDTEWSQWIQRKRSDRTGVQDGITVFCRQVEGREGAGALSGAVLSLHGSSECRRLVHCRGHLRQRVQVCPDREGRGSDTEPDPVGKELLGGACKSRDHTGAGWFCHSQRLYQQLF